MNTEKDNVSFSKSDLPLSPGIICDAAAPSEEEVRSADSGGEVIAGRYKIESVYKKHHSSAIYKVREVIGSGEVFSLREFILSSENTENLEPFAKDFEKIAVRLSAVSHPNISGIHDFFSINNHFYIVYDYIPGQTLTSFLEKFHCNLGQALPEGFITLIALKLCDCFEYLHSLKPQPYYMIDLKPSSVVIADDASDVYLLNPGIPYIIDSLSSYDNFDDYEPLDKKYISTSHDIWCIGAIIYFLITGVDLQRFDSLEHNEINEIRPDLSKGFCEVISKALGKQRLSLFKSINEFREELLSVSRPRGVDNYDFYYALLDIPYDSYSRMYLGNMQRTAASGKSPRFSPNLLWTLNLAGTHKAAVVPFGKFIAVASSDGQLCTIDPSDGSVTWLCNLQEYINEVVTCENYLYTSSSSSPSIFCLSTLGSNPGVWRTSVDGILVNSPIIVEEVVYQISQSGVLFAFDSVSGALLWKEELGFETTAPLLFVKGKFYLPSSDGVLYVFDAKERKILWKFNTGSGISQCCSANDKSVFAVTTNGMIHSISLESPSLDWKMDVEDFVTSPIRISGKMCICITNKGIMHNITEKGNVSWKLNLGVLGDYKYCVTNNRAYITSPDGRILSIDLFTGKLVDKIYVNDRNLSQPLIYGGKLFIISTGGNLQCFG